MKKLLVAGIGAAAFCSSPALAADLPVKAPARAYVAPTPVFNWTGCYLGGNLGGAWKGWRDEHTDGFVEADKTGSGFVGGGQVGCDAQVNNNWVIGIQGMWDGSGVSASAPGNSNIANTFDVKVRSFGTLAAKLGYLVNPTLQFYGKVGYGWLTEKSTFNCEAGDCAVGAVTSTLNTSRSGLDAGLGLTWMFQPHWDLFVEWDHMWLGTKTITYTWSGCPGDCFPQNVRQSFEKVLVGIDYRFDMGKAPVAAKY